MNIVNLEDAAKEIVRASRRAAERNDSEPYVYVAGAGISAPSVPLASEIQKQCEEEAKRLGITEQPTRTSAIDQYSHWFIKAYPNAIEQQRYLQDLIRNKPITAANLRLGHLLLESSVAKILITPNFDEFASRAIAVFGETVIRICDHPETVERVDPQDRGIQIVHVHGTYRYYDLANLKPQIESRAEGSRSTSFTMLSLLDRIFVSHSPLVVGYSGWEGDVIMTALKRRLAMGKRLPYRLFWFCYRADATDLLPDWLRNHDDVIFVKPTVSGLSATAEKDLAAATTKIEANNVGASDDTREKSTISAQKVFDELIRELALDAPEIARDPLAFLCRQLRTTISGEEYSDRTGSDPYSLASVVRRIARARRLEAEAFVEVEDRFERVRDAIRRSSYSEAVIAASNVRAESLDEAHSTELIKLLTLAIDNISRDAAEIETAQCVVSICKRFPEDAGGPELDRLLAIALSTKARALTSENKSEEALSVWDEIIGNFSESSDPVIQLRMYWALEWKATLLADLGKHDAAIELFDLVLEKTADSESRYSALVATWAILDKARSLAKLGRHDSALAVLSELEDRYGGWEDESIGGNVARALARRAEILTEHGRNAEALAVADEFLRRFGDSSWHFVKTQTGWLLRTKAQALRKLGRINDALASLDEIQKRAGLSTDPAAIRPAMWAFRDRVRILIELRQLEQAVDALDQMQAQANSFSDPRFQEDLGWALMQKADVLQSMNRITGYLSTLEEVIGRFGDSSNPELADFGNLAKAKKAQLTSAMTSGESTQIQA